MSRQAHEIARSTLSMRKSTSSILVGKVGFSIRNPLTKTWSCRAACDHAYLGLDKGPPRWRSDNGFTLIELLVTLAVLGLIAMLSLPYLSGGQGAAGLSSDARLLASRFRAAREIAVSARASTVVTIDLVKAEVHGPGDWASFRFTTAERVSAATAKGHVSGPSAQITFWPDGGSSGGVVILEDGTQTRSVRVQWLTGTVSISEVVQ